MYCPKCGKVILEGGSCCEATVSTDAVTPPLKKMRVLVLFFVSIITFGIYMPVWLLARYNKFNSLHSDKKLFRSVPITAIVVYAASTSLIFMKGLFDLEGLEHIYNKLDAVGYALIIWESLKIRRILIQHFNDHLKKTLRLNAILTFFFTIFYLQYKINRLDA